MKPLSIVALVAVACLGSCGRPPPTAPVHATPGGRTATSAAPTLTQPARKSPHDTISLLLDGNRVTVVYGRPNTDDPDTGAPREVWGGLVPYEKYFRMGADEATLLVTQKPLRLGEAVVPRGAVTLFLLLHRDGSATLLVNREIGQWGIDPYRPDLELARIPLQRARLEPPVHQFTMVLDRAEDGGGVLKIMWEDRQYRVGYHVVDDGTAEGAVRGRDRMATSAAPSPR